MDSAESPQEYHSWIPLSWRQKPSIAIPEQQSAKVATSNIPASGSTSNHSPSSSASSSTPSDSTTSVAPNRKRNCVESTISSSSNNTDFQSFKVPRIASCFGSRTESGPDLSESKSSSVQTCDVYSASLFAVTKDRDEYKHRVEKAESMCEHLKSKQDQLGKKFNRLLLRYQKSKADLEKALERNLASGELKSLKAENRKAKTDLQDLLKAPAPSVYKEKLADLTNENNKLREAIENLQKQSYMKKNVSVKLIETNKLCKDLQKEKESLEEELKKKTLCLASYESLKREKGSLQEQLKEKETSCESLAEANRKLKSFCASHEKKMEEFKACTKSLHEAEKRLKISKTLCDDLKEEKESAEEKVGELCKEVQSWKTKVAEVENQCQVIQEDLNQTEADRAIAKQDCSSLRQKMGELARELHNATEQLQQSRMQVEKLNRKLTENSDLVVRQGEEVSKMEEAGIRMAQELKSKQEEVNRLGVRCEQFEKEKEALSKKLKRDLRDQEKAQERDMILVVESRRLIEEEAGRLRTQNSHLRNLLDEK